VMMGLYRRKRAREEWSYGIADQRRGDMNMLGVCKGDKLFFFFFFNFFFFFSFFFFFPRLHWERSSLCFILHLFGYL